MSEWFYAVNGVQYGPVGEDVLRGYVAEGRVGVTDVVWREGMPEWVEAEKALAVEAPFFAVGIRKLVVMSFFTLGLYLLIWFYLHWHTIKAREKSDIWPLPRAIFSIFFIHSLMSEIEAYAAERKFMLAFPKGALTTLYVLLTFAGNLPDPYWVLGFGTFIPTVMIQRQVNALHQAIGVTEDRNERLRGWNWVFVIGGGLLMLLVLIGVMLPEG